MSRLNLLASATLILDSVSKMLDPVNLFVKSAVKDFHWGCKILVKSVDQRMMKLHFLFKNQFVLNKLKHHS